MTRTELFKQLLLMRTRKGVNIMTMPTLTSIIIRCPKLNPTENAFTLPHYLIQKIFRDYKAVQVIAKEGVSVYQALLISSTQKFPRDRPIDRVDFVKDSNRVELYSMEVSETEPVEILVFKIQEDPTITFEFHNRIPGERFIDENGLSLAGARFTMWKKLRSSFKKVWNYGTEI